MDVAGGVIAGASIAIQLADSVKKLSDFWRSVEEAPLDIQTIVTDLDYLSLILQKIANETQQTQPADTILEKVLGTCEANIKALNSLVHQLEPGFSSTKFRIRKWTAIKSVLRWEKIERFSTVLDRLKVTLMLVLRDIDSHNSHIRFQLHEESVAAVRTEMQRLNITRGPDITSHIAMNQHGTAVDTIPDRPSHLLAPQHQLLSTSETKHAPSGRKFGPQWRRNLLYTDSWTKTSIWGSITVRSNHKSLHLDSLDEPIEWIEEKAQSETQTSIAVQPAEWLTMLGIKSGLHFDFTRSSIKGWKNTLSSFRAVPDDSLIFQYCEDGNIGAVRHLLSRGEASAKDTKSSGIQPLHVAAGHSHAKLCELLIAAGADKSAAYFPGSLPITPIRLAIRSWHPSGGPKDDLGSMMDTIRLFFDTFDYSDPMDAGWDIYWRLVDNKTGVIDNKLDLSSLFEWLFLHFREELKANYIENGYMRVLHYLASCDVPGALPLWLSLGPKGAINIPNPSGCTFLANRVAHLSYEEPIIRISEALTYGADPNGACVSFDLSPRMESPTSMSMYSMGGFTTWLSALQTAGIDVNEVFDEELRQGAALSAAGWTGETFQRLIDWEAGYEAPPPPDEDWCTICAEWIAYIKVQPLWAYALEEIKKGKYPNETRWATFPCSETPTHCESESDSDSDGPSNALRQEPREEGEDDEVRVQSQAAESTGAMKPDRVEWDMDVFRALHRKFLDGILTSSHGEDLLLQLETTDKEDDEESSSTRTTIHIDLERWRRFQKEDIICMDCWLGFLGFTYRDTDSDVVVVDADNDDATSSASSDHEFERFLLQP